MAKSVVQNQAFVSYWLSIPEANLKINELITSGAYKQNEIQKSSYRFKNGKDKEDGYVCRVVVEKGIHPELEVESHLARKSPKRDLREALDKMLKNVNPEMLSHTDTEIVFVDGSRLTFNVA